MECDDRIPDEVLMHSIKMQRHARALGTRYPSAGEAARERGAATSPAPSAVSTAADRLCLRSGQPKTSARAKTAIPVDYRSWSGEGAARQRDEGAAGPVPVGPEAATPVAHEHMLPHLVEVGAPSAKDLEIQDLLLPVGERTFRQLPCRRRRHGPA
jgi:hypothetical protein